jgi:hypothetical protein
MNHDPEARPNSLKWFVDIAICEIIRYGIFNDERMIGPFGSILPTVHSEGTEGNSARGFQPRERDGPEYGLRVIERTHSSLGTAAAESLRPQ